jgi:hypothetical protein
MANLKCRVVVNHLDANNKHLAQEQFLMTVVAASGSDGALRPDFGGINTVLVNNSRKRGSTFQVASYSILDHEQDNGLNEIS